MCIGSGKVEGLFPVGNGRMPSIMLDNLPCPYCKSSGKVDDRYPQWRESGQAIRNQRLNKRITLREMSKRSGIDVSSLCMMEAGVSDPASYPKL